MFDLWSLQLSVFRLVTCCLWSFTQEVHKAAVPLSMLSQGSPVILLCDLSERRVK